MIIEKNFKMPTDKTISFLNVVCTCMSKKNQAEIDQRSKYKHIYLYFIDILFSLYPKLDVLPLHYW
jgi:hypothetical protein